MSTFRRPVQTRISSAQGCHKNDSYRLTDAKSTVFLFCCNIRYIKGVRDRELREFGANDGVRSIVCVTRVLKWISKYYRTQKPIPMLISVLHWETTPGGSRIIPPSFRIWSFYYLSVPLTTQSSSDCRVFQSQALFISLRFIPADEHGQECLYFLRRFEGYLLALSIG